MKTSLEDGAERVMLTSDEQLQAAMNWAEGEGIDLQVYIGVVRILPCHHERDRDRDRARTMQIVRAPRGLKCTVV